MRATPSPVPGKLLRAVAFASALVAPCAQAVILDSGGGQFVWTERVRVTDACVPLSSGNCPLSGIPGEAGAGIRIVRLGIGGDADVSSGDMGFRLVGGGLDFTWTAGQTATPATYDLGFTPLATSGDLAFARGFAYSAELDLLALEGASLQVSWIHSMDFDGKYTRATDVLGNTFDDAAFNSSARPWIQFEYVSAIPEPQSYALLLAGLGLLGFAARRRKMVTVTI